MEKLKKEALSSQGNFVNLYGKSEASLKVNKSVLYSVLGRVVTVFRTHH